MNSKSFLLFVFNAVVLLAGCSTVLVHEAYPTHYNTPSSINCSPCFYSVEADPKSDTLLLASEVEAALSEDDRMASMMGYLAILGDPTAKIVINEGNGESRSIFHSSAYKKERDKFINKGYKQELIPGYLGYTKYKPAISNWAQVLENEYANQWLRFFKTFIDTSYLIKDLEKEERSLAAAVSDKQKALQALSNRLKRINSSISEANTEMSKINTWFSSESFTGADGYEPWVEFPDYEYSHQTDIFKPIYEQQMVNIRERFANSGVENPYLDQETVEALERANRIMLNPRNYFHHDIAEQIEAAQLSPLVIASASRSVLRQATLQAGYRASWLNSTHALGLAIDIQMNGTNYNVRNTSPSLQAVNNYILLRMIMLKAGFVNPVRYSNHYERNHFVVSKYSPTEQSATNGAFDKAALTSKQLFYFRQFNRVAKNEAKMQKSYVVKIRNQIRVHGNSMTELSQEISEKTQQIAEREQALNATRQRLEARRAEQRAEAERRERIARQRELERERREAAIAARLERQREIRERHEREQREREHRERMERERQQMERWMREVIERDIERERMREMERRGGGVSGGLA